ncbi:MAG TPA: hypothetical protein VE398_10990 [Acidobacteriota bacterium]|nr:hypothetical protein [Acidobacteriota bacterium]
MTKEQILQELQLFSLGGEGIGGWISPSTNEQVFDRLSRLEAEPLSKVQLNQLLVLGREAPVSDDVFRYYWLEAPSEHPYPVEEVPGFQRHWAHATRGITSLLHLKWGLSRLFIDGLLYFGNVRTAYRQLRSLTRGELTTFFSSRRVDTQRIKDRGPSLPLRPIAKDDRYLISEMACKSYGNETDATGELKSVLRDAMRRHLSSGGGRTTFRRLIEGSNIPPQFSDRQQEFLFSTTDVLDDEITSENDLDAKLDPVVSRFSYARQAALENTKYYLSMADDLDVYVATSMRNRQDFREMANACERIFGDPRLRDLQLRYFDPTLSAAAGHEDKGLIECLMVKCAKVLVYCAGERESYGKDAEAAMALSLGKPVIFYCDQERRSRFYREVHPLSRLVEFDTGVVVGAMVTDSIEQVSDLLFRIFENQMRYQLEQPRPGYLRLKEETTGSVVRLQTADEMLTSTFFNLYHSRDSALRVRTGA